jgi:DNA-binding Xre family transcriptional regulator
MARVVLNEILKKKRISRYAFAKRLGIDYKNTPRMFHDGFNPRVSDLARYAKAIGCKVRDLIKE